MKKIIIYGGSAGGLLVANVANQIPELLLGAIMAVPFVDNLTTNMDHSLPPHPRVSLGSLLMPKIIKSTLNTSNHMHPTII